MFPAAQAQAGQYLRISHMPCGPDLDHGGDHTGVRGIHMMLFAELLPVAMIPGAAQMCFCGGQNGVHLKQGRSWIQRNALRALWCFVRPVRGLGWRAQDKSRASTGTLISSLWGPLIHSTSGVCINQCKPLRQFEFQALKPFVTGFKPEIT